MASEIAFQPMHPDSGALSQFASLLIEYGHPGIFLLAWSSMLLGSADPTALTDRRIRSVMSD